jgi:antitoxin HicB
MCDPYMIHAHYMERHGRAAAEDTSGLLSNDRRHRCGAGMVARAGQGRSGYHRPRSDAGAVPLAGRNAAMPPAWRRPVGSPQQPSQQPDRTDAVFRGSRPYRRGHGFIKKTRKTPAEAIDLADKTKNPHWGSTLDDFLDEEGTREAFQAVAIKEVLSWQIAQAMKSEGISRKKLAERMGTSRSQVSRLLDPKDGNVTIVTLQRAAELLGRKVRLELI